MLTLAEIHRPRTPGLFITGTDTGVGKTVVACLIADQWRRDEADTAPRSRIGVLKPVATDCRRERERLVSDDAEQLAHAADFNPDIGDLSIVSPITMRDPLAPAAALERAGRPTVIDWTPLDRSLRRLDERCERILVEGVGGLLVPLEQERRRAACVTTLDLMIALGYPVVVVCRAGLGTLNHTALTCQLIRAAGLTLAGLVLNGYDPDSPDVSQLSNRSWLERQNQTRVLATLPGRPDGNEIGPRPGAAKWDVRAISPDLRDAIDQSDFNRLARPGRAPQRAR